MAESSPSRIVLRKVNFHSSGIYRCEITSSNFEIYEKYEQMTVIGKYKKSEMAKYEQKTVIDK